MKITQRVAALRRLALLPPWLAVWLLVAAVGQESAGAATASCAGQANCTETLSFVATVSDFRTSVSGADRVATATLRFENKLSRPLILGYVTGSGVVTDDKGNRFVPSANGVRGIGIVAGAAAC